jgi:hypothetical protein
VILIALLLMGDLVMQALPASAGVCTSDMNLGQVIDRGRTMAQTRKKPRQAIKDCFRPFLQTSVFRLASTTFQEVYLFEYLQSCQSAAKNEVREEYYTEAAKVAMFYLSWYPSRERQLPPEYRRATEVTYELGDACAELVDWSTLLREFTKLAHGSPQYLVDERSLLEWFTALRTEGVATPRDVTAARERMANESDYRADWQLFHTTALALKKDRRYSENVRKALQFAEKVLK